MTRMCGRLASYAAVTLSLSPLRIAQPSVHWCQSIDFGIGLVQERVHPVERVARGRVGGVAEGDRAVAAGGLAEPQAVRPAVEMASDRDDVPGLRHREGLGAPGDGAGCSAAGNRVHRVRDARNDAQPVRRNRLEALVGIDGDPVLHVRLAALVAMVHDHPDHLPLVLGAGRVSITPGQRERPELLGGAVEALLDGVVGTRAVTTRVVRAAVGEDVVMQHQLRLRNLVATRVYDPNVHADDVPGHRRRLDDVVVPERLIAADRERPDPKHVRLEPRIRVMTGRRLRHSRPGQLLSLRARARLIAGGHQQCSRAHAHKGRNDESGTHRDPVCRSKRSLSVRHRWEHVFAATVCPKTTEPQNVRYDNRPKNRIWRARLAVRQQSGRGWPPPPAWARGCTSPRWPARGRMPPGDRPKQHGRLALRLRGSVERRRPMASSRRCLGVAEVRLVAGVTHRARKGRESPRRGACVPTTSRGRRSARVRTSLAPVMVHTAAVLRSSTPLACSAGSAASSWHGSREPWPWRGPSLCAARPIHAWWTCHAAHSPLRRPIQPLRTRLAVTVVRRRDRIFSDPA